MSDGSDPTYDTLAWNAPFNVLPRQTLIDTQTDVAKLQRLTTNQFLINAFRSVVGIRNALGSIEGYIADQTESAASDILCAITEINTRPAEFICSVANASRDPKKYLSEIITQLQVEVDKLDN